MRTLLLLAPRDTALGRSGCPGFQGQHLLRIQLGAAQRAHLGPQGLQGMLQVEGEGVPIVQKENHGGTLPAPGWASKGTVSPTQKSRENAATRRSPLASFLNASEVQAHPEPERAASVPVGQVDG